MSHPNEALIVGSSDGNWYGIPYELLEQCRLPEEAVAQLGTVQNVTGNAPPMSFHVLGIQQINPLPPVNWSQLNPQPIPPGRGQIAAAP